MTSNNRKRAIRAYAAEHGVNYTSAMRALDRQRAAREAAAYCTYCRTPLTTPTRCDVCCLSMCTACGTWVEDLTPEMHWERCPEVTP